MSSLYVQKCTDAPERADHTASWKATLVRSLYVQKCTDAPDRPPGKRLLITVYCTTMSNNNFPFLQQGHKPAGTASTQSTGTLSETSHGTNARRTRASQGKALATGKTVELLTAQEVKSSDGSRNSSDGGPPTFDDQGRKRLKKDMSLDERREINRLNAARNRKRQKEVIADLQKRLEQAAKDHEEARHMNSVLKAQVQVLERQNQMLLQPSSSSSGAPPASSPLPTPSFSSAAPAPRDLQTLLLQALQANQPAPPAAASVPPPALSISLEQLLPLLQILQQVQNGGNAN